MKRYEYKTIDNPSEEILNKWGENGWELISVYKIHPENIYTKFVFKRELTI